MARELFDLGNALKSESRILYVSFIEENWITELFYNYILAINAKVTGLFCLVLIIVCLFTPLKNPNLMAIHLLFVKYFFRFCSFFWLNIILLVPFTKFFQHRLILQTSQVLYVSFKTGQGSRYTYYTYMTQVLSNSCIHCYYHAKLCTLHYN